MPRRPSTSRISKLTCSRTSRTGGSCRSDYQTLVDDPSFADDGRQLEVVMLRAGDDGVEQITRALAVGGEVLHHLAGIGDESDVHSNLEEYRTDRYTARKL